LKLGAPPPGVVYSRSAQRFNAYGKRLTVEHSCRETTWNGNDG
jgi:hypothetical protein